MNQGQQSNKDKFFLRASIRQRLIASGIFVAVAGLFFLFFLAANGTIDIEHWLNPCGFKQRHNLPCPTCGMTTSALAFVQGKIFESFYIQPAGALFCSLAAISAILALFTTVSGVYFSFLKRFAARVKTRYIILALIIVIAAGWAVTLLRAIDY